MRMPWSGALAKTCDETYLSCEMPRMASGDEDDR